MCAEGAAVAGAAARSGGPAGVAAAGAAGAAAEVLGCAAGTAGTPGFWVSVGGLMEFARRAARMSDVLRDFRSHFLTLSMLASAWAALSAWLDPVDSCVQSTGGLSADVADWGPQLLGGLRADDYTAST